MKFFFFLCFEILDTLEKRCKFSRLDRANLGENATRGRRTTLARSVSTDSARARWCVLLAWLSVSGKKACSHSLPHLWVVSPSTLFLQFSISSITWKITRHCEIGLFLSKAPFFSPWINTIPHRCSHWRNSDYGTIDKLVPRSLSSSFEKGAFFLKGWRERALGTRLDHRHHHHLIFKICYYYWCFADVRMAHHPPLVTEC